MVWLSSAGTRWWRFVVFSGLNFGFAACWWHKLGASHRSSVQLLRIGAGLGLSWGSCRCGNIWTKLTGTLLCPRAKLQLFNVVIPFVQPMGILCLPLLVIPGGFFLTVVSLFWRVNTKNVAEDAAVLHDEAPFIFSRWCVKNYKPHMRKVLVFYFQTYLLKFIFKN